MEKRNYIRCELIKKEIFTTDVFRHHFRFLDFLNSRHPNIKFPMELEENREIPFLDYCIKRDHNIFSTTIHHKKTFTSLYTKWEFFTPRKYKVNLIRTLTYRCLRICSKSTLLQSALSDLKNSLLQNGYPKGVINYNIKDLLHKHKNNPTYSHSS